MSSQPGQWPSFCSAGIGQHDGILPSKMKFWPFCRIPISPSRRFRLFIASIATVCILVIWREFYTLSLLRYTSSWAEWSHHGQSGQTEQMLDAVVDWSQFAYVQYVTDSDYLCNSVMLFEILNRLGSRPDRVLMYPSHMLDPDDSANDFNDSRLLIKARDEYKVRLLPIQIQHRSTSDSTWENSFTKLLAFNRTEYARVLSLDSDATILQSMDELFLLPPCPVAMPRAYWLYPDKQILASHVMLVQPSRVEFERITAEINSAAKDEYDMEIVNNLFKDQALVLPHRPYGMLTGEFRTDDHGQYLGSDRERWDPVAALNEAKLIHFSDWPVLKPWLESPDSVREEIQPKCHKSNGTESCIERDLWNGFYTDFKERRQRVCGLDMMPIAQEPSLDRPWHDEKVESR